MPEGAATWRPGASRHRLRKALENREHGGRRALPVHGEASGAEAWGWPAGAFRGCLRAEWACRAALRGPLAKRSKVLQSCMMETFALVLVVRVPLQADRS